MCETNGEGYHDTTADQAIERVYKEQMLKACTYCGRVHDKKYKCSAQLKQEEKRKKRKKHGSEQNTFRGKNVWRNKSWEIRERDCFVCQSCLHGLTAKGKSINSDNLSVHHIIPLEEDDSFKLDNDWLITLCDDCHELAEKGEISREKMHNIAQNNGFQTPI